MGLEGWFSNLDLFILVEYGGIIVENVVDEFASSMVNGEASLDLFLGAR